MINRIKFLKGRVYQTLLEHGPMTYAQLCAYIPGTAAIHFQRCVNHDKRQYAPEQNSFRVVGWHRNIGQPGDMSPIVGVGPGADVPKPEVDVGREASRRKVERVAVARAYRDAPEQRTAEMGKLLSRHVAEANDGCERAALVFASMFTPPQVVHASSIPRRVYKTRSR